MDLFDFDSYNGGLTVVLASTLDEARTITRGLLFRLQDKVSIVQVVGHHRRVDYDYLKRWGILPEFVCRGPSVISPLDKAHQRQELMRTDEQKQNTTLANRSMLLIWEQVPENQLNEQSVRKLFFNGRHDNLGLIIESTYSAFTLPRRLRVQLDRVFFGQSINQPELDRVYALFYESRPILDQVQLLAHFQQAQSNHLNLMMDYRHAASLHLYDANPQGLIEADQQMAGELEILRDYFSHDFELPECLVEHILVPFLDRPVMQFPNDQHLATDPTAFLVTVNGISLVDYVQKYMPTNND